MCPLDSTVGDLPFIDDQVVVVHASRAEVWASLERTARHGLSRRERAPLELLLGTADPGGFRIESESPNDRLVLVGRHRFSRYRLEFELVDGIDGSTWLGARTYAAFDGWAGQVYRTLVIGSGAHVVATRALLRRISKIDR